MPGYKSVANKTNAPSDEAPSNPQVAGCPCALFMPRGGSEDLGRVTNRSGGSESAGPHLSTIVALKNQFPFRVTGQSEEAVPTQSEE